MRNALSVRKLLTGKPRLVQVRHARHIVVAAQLTRSEPVAAAQAQTHPPANQAKCNCVKAIARELGGTVSASDLRVISSEFSQAGTSVTVHVPTAEAPWACVVDRDGSVSRVYYTAEG